MKTTAFVLGLAVALLATQVAAGGGFRAARDTTAVVLGFYGGQTVRYFDFGPIKLKPGNKLAPIWTFTNGADGQRNIIDAVPGQAGYSPLWEVKRVTWAEGATPRVLTSAAEVREAEADGDVTIGDTAIVVNCPVLGFGQARIPGFSRGKTIHYYDLGPVKVAPGNQVVPLWTVTNGLNRQRNIVDVTPGQTAYPPLWAVIKVTWKPSARKRLLTLYAAIKKARAAGEVTLQRTTLVVNCPSSSQCSFEAGPACGPASRSSNGSGSRRRGPLFRS